LINILQIRETTQKYETKLRHNDSCLWW